MQKRLCGREQEFGMKVLPPFIPSAISTNLSTESRGEAEGSPEQQPSSPEQQIKNQFETWCNAIINEVIKEIGRQFGEGGAVETTMPFFWLVNGGRVYPDQSHLEFAGAEGLAGSFDGVLQEKASELIISAAAEKMVQFGLEELSFYKNNTGPVDENQFFLETTYGSHHNYSYQEKHEPMVFYLLTNFLPAALPFSGNGHIQRMASGKFIYALSERALYVELADGKITASQTTEHRTLLNDKNEPFMDPSTGLKRLHLISRDATRCELQTWLVDAMTHFVLRLAEEDWKLPYYYRIVDPVAEWHRINCCMEQGLDYKIKCFGHDLDFAYVDIWDYNRLFLDYAKQLNPLSDMEKMALEEWARVLELLKAKALDELVGELDWVTKRFWLKTEMKQFGFGIDSVQAYVLCREYHNISPSPQKSLFALLDEEGLIRHLVSREEIERARFLAPATRARSRGEFVQMCRRYPELRERVQNITWEGVCLRKPGVARYAEGELIAAETGYYPSQNPDVRFGEIGDPFSPQSSSLEKFYKDMGLSPAA